MIQPLRKGRVKELLKRKIKLRKTIQIYHLSEDAMSEHQLSLWLEAVIGPCFYLGAEKCGHLFLGSWMFQDWCRKQESLLSM